MRVSLRIIAGGLSAFFLAAACLPSAAQVPATLNYQGNLTNAGGAPLNGVQAMTFALYDNPTAGVLLWSETQNVTVTNGLFSVALGAGVLTGGNPLGTLAFDRPYYLSVTVGAETLTPRQALSSAAFARHAVVADSVISTAPLRIGTDNAAPCDTAHAGAIRYNDLSGTLQFCFGGTWRDVSMTTYSVGGTIAGLAGTLQLQLNGVSYPVSGSTFTLPQLLAPGASYAVTVFANPPGVVCAVANGSGTVSANVTNVAVTCSSPQPILAYAFEGNGNNTGSIAGSTMVATTASFVPGKVGQGLQFGTNGFAQAPGMKVALAQPQLTVAFWLNTPTLLAGQAFWDASNRSVAPFGGVQLGETASPSSSISVCVSSTSNAFLSGGCNGFAPAPTQNAWHHWIIRYLGTGLGAGQGGPTEIYVDDVLVLTRANDLNNDPVFTSAISDFMTLGGNGAIIDEIKVFNRTFTRTEQCTYVIGGTWNGTGCVLP